MRTQGTRFRLLSALAIAGLLLGPGAAGPARAQTDNPPAADPPARVGRLANLTGTVSFRTADDAEWQPATLNYPVTTGNSFWTEPGASAAIEVGATRLAMGAGTELDIDTLDDHTLAATVPQGTLYVELRELPDGDSYQVATPRGGVTVAQAGRYAINAGDTDHPTTVTVVDGSAQVSGPGVTAVVGPQQTAVITGADTFQATVGPAEADPDMAALLGPETPPAPPPGSVAPPPLVAQMTGGEALAETGTWANTPDYGQVWYPPVAVGWTPYRDGQWAFVAPWGWTWVDAAPWGFAPFHYGRWARFGPRWGWVPVLPGVAVSVGIRPVYAPALVGFVGFGAGLAIGASVGWFPLGPREPYFPPYRHSDAYIRNINPASVTNVTNFTNTNTRIDRFVNYRAATMVPATVMTGSRPIARQVRPFTPQAFAAARPVTEAPVRPTAATAGVTPTVARQYNIPRPAPGTAAARPSAPGPAVAPHPPGAVRLRPAAPAATARPTGTGAPVGAGGAPAPHVSSPPPVPSHATPPPAVQHVAPPVVQRPAPPVVQHAPPPVVQRAPPPVQRAAPPPVHYAAPPPAQRAAPRPQPQPQRRPANCPQGRPSC